VFVNRQGFFTLWILTITSLFESKPLTFWTILLMGVMTDKRVIAGEAIHHINRIAIEVDRQYPGR